MGYRLDIQLLRAFAVIVVVLYHLGVPFFSRGFLGVDVFFVISGFLMSVLYKEGQPIDFFKRRIRRLLPPYLFVLVASLIFGLIFLFPKELDQLLKQSVYALFFASNIGFWTENSYFASQDFRPLLHFWSLGVEVQYYLFVPLILWLFRKHSFSIILLALGSLALCSIILYASTRTSFFMMPLRAWEFLIGAIAGLYLTNAGAIRKPESSWIGVISLAGLIAMLLYPVDGEIRSFAFGHPGLAALLICLLTMGILAYGLPKTLQESLLAKPFIYVGKISYTVYLVHFPVIAFYFYEPFSGTILTSGKTMDTVFVLAITSGLSILCYYLIEKPGPKLNQVLIAVMASASVIAVSLLSWPIIQQRFTPNELGFLLGHEDRGEARCGQWERLIRIPGVFEPFGLTCLLGNDDQQKSVLLVGNSHADSIKREFSDVARQYGFQTYFVIDNTPLMPGGMGVNDILAEAKFRNVDLIVTHHSPSVFDADVYRGLHQAADTQGIPLVAIGPIPVYGDSIPKLIYRAHASGEKLISLKSTREQALESAHITSTFSELHSENPSTFSFYDPSAYLCDHACRIIGTDGKVWYMDGGHLTLSGSAQLKPMFDVMFREISNLSVSQNIKRF